MTGNSTDQQNQTKSSVDIDSAFARCRTLLDALLTINSLGVTAGMLEVSTDSIHGWIAFQGKHIVKALVAETAQEGRGALQVLFGISDGTFRYISHRWPETSGPWREPDGKGQDDRFMQASMQRSHDETTMMFGGEVVIIRPDKSENHEPLWRPPMSEAEFRKGVFETDSREQFLQKSEWLAGGNPRAKDFDPAQQASQAKAEEEYSPVLAKAGFKTDFQDSRMSLNRRHAFHVSRSNIPALEPPTKTGTVASKLVKIAAIPIELLVGWLIVSTLIASFGPSHSNTSMPATSGEAPFKLPPGSNSAPPATSIAADSRIAATSPSATASDITSTKPAVPQSAARSLPHPADEKEFALADSAEKLGQLEALIYDYIAQRKFRHARDLAGAGLRSPFATDEQRQKFWNLFSQCKAELARLKA